MHCSGALTISAPSSLVARYGRGKWAALPAEPLLTNDVSPVEAADRPRIVAFRDSLPAGTTAHSALFDPAAAT